MTDSERKILIKHYAKMIAEHNLWPDDLRETVKRMSELESEMYRPVNDKG